MNPRPQPMPAIAVALLSLLGTAVNGLGFVASDLKLTKLVRGVGFLAPLLLVGPLGVGLLVVGLLEAAAAVALLVGGVMLLCRRRAGTWVSSLACLPGLLAGLLLVTQIVPAPLVFGKTMAGLPTQVVPWVIFVYSFVTAISTVALMVSQPAHAGSGSPSRPCSMA